MSEPLEVQFREGRRVTQLWAGILLGPIAWAVDFVLSYAAQKDRRRALLAGFQTHLGKPIDPDELLAVVTSLCLRKENSE